MPDVSVRTCFLGFLRLGATAYGGPAMMAHLKSDLVGKRRWLTEPEFRKAWPCAR